MKRLIVTGMLALLAVGLSSCASVPMASLEADKQAKEFATDPSMANIYVYRNESIGGAVGMPVTLGGRVAGKTGPKTYFRWSVVPGKHEITSLTENTARITIDTKAGQNYFVWQEVKMGMWAARSQLHEVPAEEGKKSVKECKLLQSDI